MRENGFRKDLPARPYREFFHVYIISKWWYSFLLVKFEINLHLWVFQISAFWKTHSCKLILSWTQNRTITYT